MEVLNNFERILDVPSKAKQRILAEMGSHCEEARDELIEAGATPEDAGREACTRLGSPAQLAGDFLAVYGPGRKTFLLILFPFLMALLGRFHRTLLGGNTFTTSVDTLLLMTCLMMLAGTVWAIVRSEKPAWAATWLAGSILAVLWSSDRFNLVVGGAFWMAWITSWPLRLLPATLNLWFYRRKAGQRLYVLALWMILVGFALLLPLGLVWAPSRTMTAGLYREWQFVNAILFSLEWFLGAVAWIPLAAAVAPRGRGNWAIYSSLSTFVYLVVPRWWLWDLPNTLGFWAAVTAGPVAIWVLLYARKMWMKVTALASAVVIIGFATLLPYMLLRTAVVYRGGARMEIGWAWQEHLYSVLGLLVKALVVIAPLLIWHRRERDASDLQLAGK